MNPGLRGSKAPKLQVYDLLNFSKICEIDMNKVIKMFDNLKAGKHFVVSSRAVKLKLRLFDLLRISCTTNSTNPQQSTTIHNRSKQNGA